MFQVVKLVRYFPIFFDLEGKTVLIVGGGEAALQKARLVAKTPARIIVIAPHAEAGLRALARAGDIELRVARFTDADVDGAALVYAATGDVALNRAVADVAKRAGVPVNVVDNARASTFITPALVDRSPVVVAISTQGTAPVLARAIKARIEAMLPATLGATARGAARFRARLAALVPSARARRQFWARAFAAFEQPVNPFSQRSRLETLAGAPAVQPGRVSIVGIGPGDADLLVHKARAILDGADVVFHPADLPPAILDLARREARFVACGPGETLTEAQAGAARGGELVVSLVHGTGQQPDHVAALRAAGVAVEIIPGIDVTARHVGVAPLSELAA